MKEKLRDQSRDNLARALNDIGVTASLAERNRTEEQVELMVPAFIGNNRHFLRACQMDKHT